MTPKSASAFSRVTPGLKLPVISNVSWSFRPSLACVCMGRTMSARRRALPAKTVHRSSKRKDLIEGRGSKSRCHANAMSKSWSTKKDRAAREA